MLGVLELEESFDSCITATIMLCRSKNLHNSVSLLPLPFALNCIMVNEFPSTAFLELMVVAVVVSVEWMGTCNSCIHGP